MGEGDCAASVAVSGSNSVTARSSTSAVYKKKKLIEFRKIKYVWINVGSYSFAPILKASPSRALCKLQLGRKRVIAWCGCEMCDCCEWNLKLINKRKVSL
jgi:hypothetical protein